MQNIDQRILELKKRKLKLLRDEPHRFYVPNGKVEQFISLVGNNETFIVLFSAGNGVGKTAAGANILAHMMFPVNSEWFNYPLFKKFPYLKRGRIISDPATVKSTTVQSLKEWLPANRYEARAAGKAYESQWSTDTGFEFDVMTYDQDPKEFESVTLGWAWFDEPPPEAIYKATVSRMRRGGIIFITATPLKGSAWMYDAILTNPEGGQRAYVEAGIEDNCKQHGIRGMLDHEHIDKMVKEYNEEDRHARVLGKFQHLTGLVHKRFSRNVHVIKPFYVNPKDYCVFERLDIHPRNPDACSWVAVDRKGRKFVVDELYMSGSTEELAARIKQKASQYRIIDRKIDPSAFIEDQHIRATKNSLAKRLSSLGLDYLPASKQRTMAIRRVDDALNYEMRGDIFIREPELFVFDTCTRHIWEFEHWQWNEYTGKSAEKKNKSEKPQDKDDHMMESLGRNLIDELVFVEPQIQGSGYHEEPVFDPFAS